MLGASIQGRSVIVTGASKGIGKGMARVFADHGAKVLIVGRDLRAAEAAAEELGKAGGTVSAFSADIGKFSEIVSAAKAAVERYGGLDVLCANAGIYQPPASVEEMTPEQWDDVVGTNLKGTFLSIKACLPYLKKSDQGRIILTSSITGPHTGIPNFSHYGASKSGQLGLMRTVCLEVAKYGITINSILPGNIATEGLAVHGEEYWRSMLAAVPLKRLGEPADIGHVALFLATKEAGYITGQTIIVDGGQTIPESLEALG